MHFAAAMVVSGAYVNYLCHGSAGAQKCCQRSAIADCQDIAAKINNRESYEKLCLQPTRKSVKAWAFCKHICCKRIVSVINRRTGWKGSHNTHRRIRLCKGQPGRCADLATACRCKNGVGGKHTTNEKAAFVAVGWSLEEVEKESNLVTMIAIAWVGCIAVILIHFVLYTWLNKKTSCIPPAQ